MPGAYYNENDPYCVEWLRNLIHVKLIAPGDVDPRPIQDVKPYELASYTQCHFFAGIGGWSRALRLASFPDNRKVWTGSCPCQPFSQAGNRRGFSDERHLWPFWQYLIDVCRPPAILGEQVASAADWLRLVRGDLEALGYTVGAIPIEAASAGADQFRDRYWFVAGIHEQREGDEHLQRSGQFRGASGDSQDTSLTLVSTAGDGWGEGWTEHEFRSRGFAAAVASIRGSQVVECPDGKWRRLPPPRVRWLGDGIPARVAKLRALGNAIDPQVAAEFIRAACQPQDS